MQRLEAPRGVCTCTSLPCQYMEPLVGAQIPDTVLISVDFPAPLSPIKAVTCPAGMSRSTCWRACTAPKLLVMPRKLNSVDAEDSTPEPAGSGCPTSDDEVRSLFSGVVSISGDYLMPYLVQSAANVGSVRP